MTWNLQRLRKSRRDAWLAGVCGGLGEHTPLPAWLWRALFLATSLGIGVGFVAYVALWLFMPAAGWASPSPAVARPAGDGDAGSA
ncbi:PspC domain-containing protein [Pseudoxanthomonas suwonensis]|uniref:PspC domain-containing protein n=1 Tax=Pseudoxanthomonas suwonensis TaxID=314722 RepID=UPI000695AB20|nr:PspC domain-containing protein [Pseudoxanthomonas suwonensis]